MKTLITLSSILAAGTLAANAGVVLTVSDFSTDKTEGTVSYATSTKRITGDGIFGANGNFRNATTVVFALNLTELGISESALTLAEAKQIVTVSPSAATGSNIGLRATTDGLQYTWGSDVWSNYSSYYVPYADLLNKSKTINDKQYVVLGFITPSVLYTSPSTYSNGTNIVYGDGTFANANNGSSIKASNLTSDKSYNTIIVDGYSVLGGLSVISGVATTAEIVSAQDAIIQAIPEPSAFGLLAGIGALALAGTRRRRKVK